MQKSNIYVTKDSREMAYYIENGVQPYQLKGYKGVLSAYFHSEDIQDMRENWYPDRKERSIIMETVKIVNLDQVSKYIQHGIKPVDIQYTNRLVFVFDKEQTKDVFKKWRNYEL